MLAELDHKNSYGRLLTSRRKLQAQQQRLSKSVDLAQACVGCKPRYRDTYARWLVIPTARKFLVLLPGIEDDRTLALNSASLNIEHR